MIKALAMLMLTTLPIMAAWDAGDDLQSATNWGDAYHTMRDHNVMNLFATEEPWGGASFWMASRTSMNLLPDIDPAWWSGAATNGGWMKTGRYNYDENAPVDSRLYDFSSGIAKDPYVHWYVYEAQAWIQSWFNSGRIVYPGTETNWNGSVGGSNMTLAAALDLAGMDANGVRRSSEIGPDTNVIIVTGTTTPDMSGRYVWSGGSYHHESVGSKFIQFWDGRNVLTDDMDETFIWTNSAGYTGTYTPDTSTTATGTATAVYLEDYIFTNGWAQSGDFTGFWHRDDITNLLSVVKAGWYVPNKSSGTYQEEDTFSTFYGHETLPLYLRSGVYYREASFSTNYTIGYSTNRTDMIVTNTTSPDCDGGYVEGWLSDYGRITGDASIEEQYDGSWIITGSSNYVSVSGSTNADAHGDYQYVTTSDYTNAAWGIRESDDASYSLLFPLDDAYSGYLIAVTGAVSPDITGGWELYATPHKGEWSIVVTNGNCYILRSNTLTLSSALFNGTGNYTTSDVEWPDDASNWGTYTHGSYTWSIGVTGFEISDGYTKWHNDSFTDVFAQYRVFSYPYNNTADATIERWVKSGTNIYGAYTPDPHSPVTGTAYLIDTSFNGYTNDTLAGEYSGVGICAGDTGTVHAAYFYRDGTVTGLYENIGMATSAGTAEVIEGPGWTDWIGADQPTDAEALAYIASNYTSIASASDAAMSSFSTTTFSTDRSKGTHERGLTSEVFEEIISTGPSPTNYLKKIYLYIYENDLQESPACVVYHKFGDGTSIAAARQLPSITNVFLFNEDGYYTNSFGLNYSDGNKFPYVSSDMLKFTDDSTYFKSVYDSEITNSTYGYSLGYWQTNINFIGWVMQFDVE